MHVDGFQGKGLVNSFHGGDGTTGTLTSPEFKIERKFITFLIGGGRDAAKTCMNLLVDGKVVRTATGPNDKPGGSEALAPESWDVSEFAGKTAVIQIVDQATGGWGHINVDQIVQTDRKPPRPLANARASSRSRSVTSTSRSRTARPSAWSRLLVDGRVEVKNDIELANAAPDWWAFMDVSAWRGKTVTLQVDKLPEDSTALSAIEQSDAIKGAGGPLPRAVARAVPLLVAARLEQRPERPGLLPRRVSPVLPAQSLRLGLGQHALGPRGQPRPGSLAGTRRRARAGRRWARCSAAARWWIGRTPAASASRAKPRAGAHLHRRGKPDRAVHRVQHRRRHFTKFSGNPVVKQITGGNRDPKVIWHEPTKKWVMTLYVGAERQAHDPLPHLAQPEGLDSHEPARDGFFECPDFFELPVDGDAAQPEMGAHGREQRIHGRHVRRHDVHPRRHQSSRAIAVGASTRRRPSATSRNDGRRIQIGWFQTETPGMPFNQSMTIPLELKLISTPDGPRLTWTPVKELAPFAPKSHRFDPVTLQPDAANPLAGVKAELVELRAEFEPGDASEVAFTVRGATIVYDAKKQELVVNDHRAPAPLRDGKQRLTIFCDRTGLEVFASDGLTYVPMPFQPKADDLGLGLQVKGGSAKVSALEVHELRSAWGTK